MDFIKKMKKREFIEMGLKTLAAICAAFVAIILMEGMIYGIHLNSLKKNYVETKNGTNSLQQQDSTIAYAIKEGNDKYFVVLYNEGYENPWSAEHGYMSKAEVETDIKNNVAKLEYRAPTAFELTITPVHYVVMAIFVSAVAGFFVYKFVKLANQYKKIEEEFEKTGNIEITYI